MMRWCVAAMAGVLVGAPAAALRHVDLAFTARDFTSLYSGPDYPAPPQNVVTGRFAFDYDPATQLAGDPVAKTQVSLTVAGYTYAPATVSIQIADNYVFIKGAATLNGQLLGTDIFQLLAYNVFGGGTPPFPPAFLYSVASDFGNRFDAQQVEVSASAVDSTVPEPASWMLLIGGFAAVGVASRARRASASAAA